MITGPWPGTRNPTAATGAGLLIAIAALCLVGPWFAPDPSAIADPAASGLLPPLSARWQLTLADGSSLLAERLGRERETLLVIRLGTETRLAASAVAAVKRRVFVLGTDSVGRDVLARVLSGGRVSLAVGAAALAVALVLGVGLGLVAGWRGGGVDAVIMRVVDAALAVPILFLMLLLATLVQPSPTLLVLVLGASSWMGVARLVRGQVQSIKERPFIQAARVAGASGTRIALRHVLPNTLTPLTQDAALRLGDLILVEASLSFLGFGVRPPTPSWGTMVADGQAVLPLAWWPTAFPVALVALTVIGAALVADGLQQARRRQPAVQ